MENDPCITVGTEHGDFEVRRDNSTLYRFIGEVALNHVFVVTDKEEREGFYVWRHMTGYEQVSEYMIENEYPVLLNLREVPEYDRKAYDRHLEYQAEELDSGIPEEWL